jgi:hypothetical protein
VALPGTLTVPWMRRGVAAGNGTVSESASFSASSVRSGWEVSSVMPPIFSFLKGENQDFFSF